MRKCLQCGKEFDYRHNKKVYCEDKCRSLAHWHRAKNKPVEVIPIRAVVNVELIQEEEMSQEEYDRLNPTEYLPEEEAQSALIQFKNYQDPDWMQKEIEEDRMKEIDAENRKGMNAWQLKNKLIESIAKTKPKPKEDFNIVKSR